MKKKTLFLLAPLAMAALASCGGSTNWSKITCNKAVEKAAEFSENLGKYNKKASRVNVTGTVNTLNFKGDLHIRSSGAEIDTKGASVTMSNQRIAKTSIDLSSIRTIADTNLPEVMYFLTFPVNKHVVRFANGVKKLPLAYYYDSKFNWDTVEDANWENIDTTFYAGDGKLKINLKSDKVVAAIDEIDECLSNPKAGFSSDTDIKASISLSTNKWGYVESLSVNVKAPAIEYEDLSDYPDIVKIDGSLNFSASLHFDYEYVETRTIQYQVGIYKADGSLDKVTDIKNVEDFKEYFTGEWYNYNNPNPKSTAKEIDSYDDPYFNLYYWIKRSRSIAYTGEGYSLNIIPAFDKPIKDAQGVYHFNPKYNLLMNKSFIAVDGKKLEDPLQTGSVVVKGKDYPNFPYVIEGKTEYIQDVDNIGVVYLNGDYISSFAKDSKVIVYVAVTKVGA